MVSSIMLSLEETHLSIVKDRFLVGNTYRYICSIEYVTLLQCTHIEVGRGLEYVIVLTTTYI